MLCVVCVSGWVGECVGGWVVRVRACLCACVCVNLANFLQVLSVRVRVRTGVVGCGQMRKPLSCPLPPLSVSPLLSHTMTLTDSHGLSIST